MNRRKQVPIHPKIDAPYYTKLNRSAYVAQSTHQVDINPHDTTVLYAAQGREVALTFLTASQLERG